MYVHCLIYTFLFVVVGIKSAKAKGQTAWEEKYFELLEYKTKYGNCDVPTKLKENRALGRWVSTQRAMYKRLSQPNNSVKFTDGAGGKLSVEEVERRIAKLDSIGFTWTKLSFSDGTADGDANGQLQDKGEGSDSDGENRISSDSEDSYIVI